MDEWTESIKKKKRKKKQTNKSGGAGRGGAGRGGAGRDQCLRSTQAVNRTREVGTAAVPAVLPLQPYRLVGLVVKASASRAGGPGFESR